MKVQILLILCSFASLSCSKNKPNFQKPIIEKLEIYNATGDSLVYKKDALLYIEINAFEGDKKLYTTYKKPDNSFKGKEVYTYVQESMYPTGVNYLDSNNVLLSYYKFVFDNKGLKKSSTAFDAIKDELLRIEKFDYDDQNNLVKKDIFDSENKLSRSYIFKNDVYGNPVQMTIINDKNMVLAIEDYKITKYDEKNKWVEKWGFVDGQAKTFHVRSFQ